MDVKISYLQPFAAKSKFHKLSTGLSPQGVKTSMTQSLPSKWLYQPHGIFAFKMLYLQLRRQVGTRKQNPCLCVLVVSFSPSIKDPGNPPIAGMSGWADWNHRSGSISTMNSISTSECSGSQPGSPAAVSARESPSAEWEQSPPPYHHHRPQPMTDWRGTLALKVTQLRAAHSAPELPCWIRKHIPGLAFLPCSLLLPLFSFALRALHQTTTLARIPTSGSTSAKEVLPKMSLF